MLKRYSALDSNYLCGKYPFNNNTNIIFKECNNLNLNQIECWPNTLIEMESFFQKELNKYAYIWNGKDINPYNFALKYSKFFIVTSDSTSMISECAFTKKPIYIFHLPFKRTSNRIKKFHDEFENRKITQKFSGHIDLIEWQYETLDEAKRISGILKERIIEGLNESR